MKMAIKKGDTVAIIAGKEKGKTGKVVDVYPETNRILVENINMVKRHQKPRSQQDKGGIITKNAPFDASNAMVVCPVCGKATRVGHTVIEGEKVRACKKCNGSLDKKYVKQSKKEVKKATTKKAETEEAKAEPKPAAAKKPATTAKKTATTTKTTTKKSTSTKKDN